MLRALVSDLVAVPGIEVSLQLDSRLQTMGHASREWLWNAKKPAYLGEAGLPNRKRIQGQVAGCNLHWVCRANDELAIFHRLAAAADVTIVIAPEFDDLLLRQCRLVEEAGGRLLGPASDAVELLTDKLATAQCLEDAGVPTPKTCLPHNVITSAGLLEFPAVLKPRFGAGSQDVQLVDDLTGFVERFGSENWIVQEFHCGQTVSVLALCGPRRVELLPAVVQRLSDDGRFRYLGGRLPVSNQWERRAHQLVRSAIDCLPRLTGFVGFDVVLGRNNGGSEDVVIEINPRLTTSYVGLRQVSRQNLAATMLECAAGKSAELSFSREPIEFSANGMICHV